MPNCPEFLEMLKNRRCVEEFIKLLPTPLRSQLSELALFINDMLEIESLVLSAFDQFYLLELSKLNAEIAAIQKSLGPLWDTYTELKKFWGKFQSCPGVSIFGMFLEDIIDMLMSPLKEKLNRKSKIFRRLQLQGVRNIDLALKEAFFSPAAPGGALGIIQDFLSGWADCLRNGIPEINPPFTGRV